MAPSMPLLEDSVLSEQLGNLLMLATVCEFVRRLAYRRDVTFATLPLDLH